MQSRRSEARSFFVLLFFVLGSASSLAHAQTVSLVQSGARFAGSNSSGFNTDFGSATAVNLNPTYLAIDSNGNQYISDTPNNCVRKLTSGNISPLVGLAVLGQTDTCNTLSNPTPTSVQGLYQPAGLALDSANNLYIADFKHNCVRELPNNSSGVASLVTVAGICDSATSPTPSPSGLAVDANNNLYIALQDAATSTFQVLQLSHSTLCLMAGNPSAYVTTLCPGVSGNVVLNAPSGIALDATGDLFIADTGNNCVREVVSLTTQRTAVGLCINDLTGNLATALVSPEGLVFSQTQFLFITEAGSVNNSVVSYDPATNLISAIAGVPSGAPGPYSISQDGEAALDAPLNAPFGVTIDSSGNLYVADSGNFILRKLTNSLLFPQTAVGSVSTTSAITFTVKQNVNLSVTIGSEFNITNNTCVGALAPTGSQTPPATCQVFVSFAPTKPGIRGAALRLTDSISHTTVVVGLQASAFGGLALFTPGIANTLATQLANPIAVALDSAGNQYVLQSGTSPNTASLLLLPSGGGAAQTLITASQGLVTPNCLALDAAGNIFIGEGNQGTVARFGADGTVNLSYLTGLTDPVSLYADSFNNLFIAQGGTARNVIEAYLGGTRRIVAGGGAIDSPNGVPATSASFVAPTSITTDLNGVLYVADGGGHYVYAIDKSGIIHQVAGNGTATTVTAGLATGTGLVTPAALATDAAGDIYIADSGANIVYTVLVTANAAGSNIAPSLGNGTAGYSGDGALATLAEIDGPLSMAVDGNANLFVVDGGNAALREVTYPNPTLAFGVVIVGQPSPVLVQSIGNFGTEGVTLSNILMSDSLFTVDPDPSVTTCGATIIVGSTCNIGFIFTPTENGPVTGTSTLVSISADTPQTITLTGTGKLPLPLKFTLLPQTEIYGQPFVESFTVANGDPYPTGTITFSASTSAGTVTLCTINASFAPNSSCSAAASGLAVGTYPVTFSYSGDSIYPGTTLPTTLTVTPAPLSITVANATRVFGAANPTFTGSLIGVVPGDIVLVSYSTTATASSAVGTYAITATLTGGGSTLLSNYTITNAPGVLTITPQIPTVTTLTASPTTVTVGTNVTFTATVTAASGSPSGTVIFTSGATVLGQQNLNASGTATFSTATLAAGSDVITATFQSSGSFGSSSASLTEIVNPAPIGSFTLTSSPATQYLTGAGATNYVITVTSVGAFTGPVTLTCSGLPADATCAFSTVPTLTAGGTAVTTLTITSTAADAELRRPGTRVPATLTSAFVFPFGLTGISAFFAGIRRRRTSTQSPLRTTKSTSNRVRLLTALILTLGILGLTGCCAITSKTYVVTVTGTSVTFTAPSQTTSVILSVGTN